MGRTSKAPGESCQAPTLSCEIRPQLCNHATPFRSSAKAMMPPGSGGPTVQRPWSLTVSKWISFLSKCWRVSERFAASAQATKAGRGGSAIPGSLSRIHSGSATVRRPRPVTKINAVLCSKGARPVKRSYRSTVSGRSSVHHNRSVSAVAPLGCDIQRFCQRASGVKCFNACTRPSGICPSAILCT